MADPDPVIVDQDLKPVEDTGPCVCWGPGRVRFHEGHCCFAAGRPIDYAPERPSIPCGHEDPASQQDVGW